MRGADSVEVESADMGDGLFFTREPGERTERDIAQRENRFRFVFRHCRSEMRLAVLNRCVLKRRVFKKPGGGRSAAGDVG